MFKFIDVVLFKKDKQIINRCEVLKRYHKIENKVAKASERKKEKKQKKETQIITIKQINIKKLQNSTINQIRGKSQKNR